MVKHTLKQDFESMFGHFYTLHLKGLNSQGSRQNMLPLQRYFQR